MAPRIALFFPFRFHDPVTGKWVRARYRAERHEIASRYAEWEITGPAEIREITSTTHYFTPHPGQSEGNSVIGRNSCNADVACNNAGLSGSSVLGNNSCGNDYACTGAGQLGGISIIGNHSCNAEAIFGICDFNDGEIGNNEFN